MLANLSKDKTTASIQAFPLNKAGFNVTTGSFNDVRLIHCSEDGDITITWSDDSTGTISCVTGDDFGIYMGKSVEVVSGTFQLA